MKPCYLFLTTGFEEIEAVATIDILRRAGLNLQTVSVENSLEVEGSHGVVVKADKLLSEGDFSEAEILVLPGGTLRLGEFPKLLELLKKQHAHQGRIAAICAAPSILGGLGLLEGREATAYPGFEGNLKGAKVSQERVVVAGNIITGKGPGCTMEFALKIVEILVGKEKSEELSKALIMN